MGLVRMKMQRSRFALSILLSLAFLPLDNPAMSRGYASSAAKRTVIAQAARTATPASLYGDAWKLVRDHYYERTFNGQNWTRWEHRYDSKLETMDDAHKAIETMLASLGDPYTRFLGEDAFNEEKRQIAATLFGVGMQLGMNEQHKVVVISPIEGAPAFRAGILPGDEIIEVNGSSVSGQSLDEVVKQIRGPKDTQVSVTLLRDAQRLIKQLTRAEIPIRAVARKEVLPGNIGYIRLDSFISSKAAEEMKDALAQVSGTDGLILDLRNNPGGLLSNAIETASMFLNSGVIVSTIDSDGQIASQRASGKPLSAGKPMVLLVNKGSASASEILALALRDNGRSKVVGEQTFGKGLVQAINKLADGSGMNLSIARYVSPLNADIHKVGVRPDYTISVSTDEVRRGAGPWWIDPSYTRMNLSPTDGNDLQLLKAIRVIRNQIAMGSGSATQPDNDEEVRRTVLSRLRPASTSTIATIGTSTPPKITTTSTSTSSSTSTSVTSNPVANQGPVKDKWALIIGISRFKKPEYNLKYASKDARDFRDFLVNEANFAADHVRLITDENATQRAIMSAFGDQWLPRVTRPGDLVVIYISTHGTPATKDRGGQNYLVAHDSDRDDLFATGIPMELLEQRIKKSVNTDRALIVMDTCYSGAAAGAARGDEQPANFAVEEIAQGTGHLVLSSSGTDQRAWESTQHQNGIFTYYLIEALRQKNKRVDLPSAFSYLKEKVEWESQRDHGHLQIPQMGGKWEGSDLILSVRAASPRALAAPNAPSEAAGAQKKK